MTLLVDKPRSGASAKLTLTHQERLREWASNEALTARQLLDKLKVFAQAQPNRSAWTPQGEVHASDARRGKRLNVVGALLSSGALFAVKLWVTMNALLFVGFLGLLMEHVGKPLVVILDNASVHKAKEIAPRLVILEGKGLRL